METVSNCCGANEWSDNTEICGQCKEHCVMIELTED